MTTTAAPVTIHPLWREVEAWEDAARARPDPEEAFRELARAANGRWDGVDAESYVADLRKDG